MRKLIFTIGFFWLTLTIVAAQTTTLGASTTLNVEGNATFFVGGSSTLNGSLFNDGNTIINQNATFIGPVENKGNLVVNGNSNIDPLTTINNNTTSSRLGFSGNSTLDGTINNSGSLFSTGGGTFTLNGSITNNSDLKMESNLSVNGSLNNNGTVGVIGNVSVTGIMTNPDGKETLIDGDFSTSSAFVNSGKLGVTGTSTISGDFTNNNEALFEGPVTFNGITTNSQTLALGSNSIFVGTLTNSGTIASVADAELNFTTNKYLGTLSFVDRGDGTPIGEIKILSSADSIFITELNLNTSGKVTLPPNIVTVETAMNIENGVVNATDQENFLVKGDINVNSETATVPSYVEGKMLAITKSGTIRFPMGINGFSNFVTLNSLTPGITVKVECKLPDPETLLTDEYTMGLAQQVEWTIVALADSAEVSVSVNYSGVDFTNTPNFINAREYDATLQRLGKGDSAFHALRTIESQNNNIGTEIPDEGTIQTSNNIWITSVPTRFALGISPVLTEPEVYLPNVFSPGASFSDNQIFRPFIGGAVISEVVFRIFDSFNREVYAESLAGEDLNLEDIGWNGNLKSGLQAPEGVYYYNVSIVYKISEDVSDKYFASGEREQTQQFSKIGTVLLVK